MTFVVNDPDYCRLAAKRLAQLSLLAEHTGYPHLDAEEMSPAKGQEP